MTVEFSNSKANVWNAIQEAIQRAGFIIANVAALDKQQGSFKAVTSTTAVKQDLVISAYKPTEENIRKIREQTNTPESAWTFINQHLEKLPVFLGSKGEATVVAERTSRILFDRMVAYHVQNGLPVPILMKKRVLFSKYVFECFESEEGLYSYLNKQWKNYLEDYLIYSNEQVAEKKDYYGNNYFEDPFIRRYMREFILPIEVPSTVYYEKWMQPGIIVKKLKNEHFDIKKGELFQQNFSSFGRTEWVKFAIELGFFQSELLEKGLLDTDFKSRISIANEAFEEWMLTKYYQLRTLPVVPKPKMVHQIPHYLAKKTDKKLALVVLDGMSFTQWNIIKKTLLKQSWSFEEDAVFTWVPSLTSVSRQAIFSGLEPRHFADTIGTTRKEKTLWSSFWKNEGLSERNVAYEKSLGLKTYNKESLVYRHSPSIRVYGAVIDVIDQFMHGAVQGSQTVFSELTTWLKSNYLHEMLSDLVEEGFEVYLTSDHGNVDCYGMGRIQEGVTVESKGERVRIYSSLNIRNQTTSENEETIPWDDSSLPSNYHVLIAKNNRAFVPKNDKIVTHGGIHIEEVIVPFVKVNR